MDFFARFECKRKFLTGETVNGGQHNYLEWVVTARLVRPLARRRLRTSRPVLVARRDLKPCLRMRLVLEGCQVSVVMV